MINKNYIFFITIVISLLLGLSNREFLLFLTRRDNSLLALLNFGELHISRSLPLEWRGTCLWGPCTTARGRRFSRIGWQRILQQCLCRGSYIKCHKNIVGKGKKSPALSTHHSYITLKLNLWNFARNHTYISGLIIESSWWQF